MSRVLVLLFAVLLALVACTPPTQPPPEDATVEGEIKTQRRSFSTSNSHISVINQINKHLIQSINIGTNQPILDYLKKQVTDDNLMLLQQQIVAVNRDGVVLGNGNIQSDGRFNLNVPSGEDFVLTRGLQNADGSWLCLQALSYGTEQTGRTTNTRLAAFNASEGSNLNLGSFALNEFDGGFAANSDNAPDALIDSSSIGNKYIECENADRVPANVSGNVRLESGFLDSPYDFGVVLTFKKLANGENTLIGSAPWKADGRVDMVHPKNRNIPDDVRVIVTDVGTYNLNKSNFPLTPTFDLSTFNPDFDGSNVGDDGVSVTTDKTVRIATLQGTVRAEGGVPVEGAFVVGALEDENALGLNVAITDENGQYSLPLITNSIRYKVVALDGQSGEQLGENGGTFEEEGVITGIDMGDAAPNDAPYKFFPGTYNTGRANLGTYLAVARQDTTDYTITFIDPNEEEITSLSGGFTRSSANAFLEPQSGLYKAKAQVGNEAFKVEVSLDPSASLAQVTNLQHGISNGVINTTWSPVNGANGYEAIFNGNQASAIMCRTVDTTCSYAIVDLPDFIKQGSNFTISVNAFSQVPNFDLESQQINVSQLRTDAFNLPGGSY